MGIWSGNNPGDAYRGTPTCASLAILDPSIPKTIHPGMTHFVIPEDALPEYTPGPVLRLASGETALTGELPAKIRYLVWGNYDGTTKWATIKSGKIGATEAYSDLWKATAAKVIFTTERIVWTRGPATDHPLPLPTRSCGSSSNEKPATASPSASSGTAG